MFDADKPTPNNEEKAFVRTAAMAIEKSLERKFAIEDIVQRYNDA
jgi:hypothetical protein